MWKHAPDLPERPAARRPSWQGFKAREIARFSGALSGALSEEEQTDCRDAPAWIRIQKCVKNWKGNMVNNPEVRDEVSYRRQDMAKQGMRGKLAELASPIGPTTT